MCHHTSVSRLYGKILPNWRLEAGTGTHIGLLINQVLELNLTLLGAWSIVILRASLTSLLNCSSSCQQQSDLLWDCEVVHASKGKHLFLLLLLVWHCRSSLFIEGKGPQCVSQVFKGKKKIRVSTNRVWRRRVMAVTTFTPCSAALRDWACCSRAASTRSVAACADSISNWAFARSSSIIFVASSDA